MDVRTSKRDQYRYYYGQTNFGTVHLVENQHLEDSIQEENLVKVDVSAK